MKRFLLKMALVCVSALMIAACDSKTKGVSLDKIAGEWEIVTIQGNPVPNTVEKTPFLAINPVENRLYGTTGCNNINGLIERDPVNETQFSFKNVATTMMMCPDMETEALVLKVLDNVRMATMPEEDKVLLVDAENKELMQLKKK
ncbi:MAG: META domain-containing protein [Phocaeicola sp.]